MLVYVYTHLWGVGGRWKCVVRTYLLVSIKIVQVKEESYVKKKIMRKLNLKKSLTKTFVHIHLFFGECQFGLKYPYSIF